MLMITDYFSKWTEVVLLKKVEVLNIVVFIKHPSFTISV